MIRSKNIKVLFRTNHHGNPTLHGTLKSSHIIVYTVFPNIYMYLYYNVNRTHSSKYFKTECRVYHHHTCVHPYMHLHVCSYLNICTFIYKNILSYDPSQNMTPAYHQIKPILEQKLTCQDIWRQFSQNRDEWRKKTARSKHNVFVFIFRRAPEDIPAFYKNIHLNY